MDKILSNLGLCARARGLAIGSDAVCDGMASGAIKLVFLANDASENTKKRICDKAAFYHAEVNESYPSQDLSRAVGKENRMVIGITNQSFLKILKK